MQFLLKSLFGCRSVERILLYLLVNETCYAHQLHRLLHAPLTPLQKALTRLEEGGVISSCYEGRTRIYQFNPDYPLLNELEMLLKQAFHQLPPHEKRSYTYLKQEESSGKKQNDILLQLVWDQLTGVTAVTLVAKSFSKQRNGWSRKGNGKVTVVQEGQTIVFNEQGSWRGNQGQTYNYTNRYRWTKDRLKGLLSLEHLRLGENNPVFLFHLVPVEGNLLKSVDSHLCGEETYFGWIQYNALFLQLNFRTIGPDKNEEIECIYT